MNRTLPLLLAFGCSAVLLIGCASVSQRAQAWDAQLGAVPTTPMSPDALYREIGITQDFIAAGSYGRRVQKPMKPRYITIHSTQNYSGDAAAHAKALKNGKLRGGVTGYLDWHYTLQDNGGFQHLPTNETGEHADFDGPGNTFSIAIEMCEHRGNNQAQTIDRTAKLAAWLMYQYKIPLSNVVPHYHWPREMYNPPNKNCPHFLMDGGKPRGTWRWFQARVRAYHDRLVAYRG